MELEVGCVVHAHFCLGVHARVQFCVNFEHYFQIYICYLGLYHVNAFANAYVAFPGRR